MPPKFGMGIERDRSWLPGFCPLLKHFTKVGPGWGVFKATLTQPAREGPPAEAVECCVRGWGLASSESLYTEIMGDQ